jgi:hypothetical protein
MLRPGARGCWASTTAKWLPGARETGRVSRSQCGARDKVLAPSAVRRVRGVEVLGFLLSPRDIPASSTSSREENTSTSSLKPGVRRPPMSSVGFLRR